MAIKEGFVSYDNYIQGSDGKHQLASYTTLSKDVVMNDDGLTLKDSEVTMSYANYQAGVEAGTLPVAGVKYIIPDYPGGSGGGSGDTTAMEITEEEYAENKDEYDIKA